MLLALEFVVDITSDMYGSACREVPSGEYDDSEQCQLGDL